MNLSWLLPAVHGIPVLMYHKVWPGINDALTITPERLREHWDFLLNEGYHTLSLPEYLEIVNGTGGFPEKSMLLTFDDGYRNNFEYAYPLLKEFGWKAVFFIITKNLRVLEERDEESPDEKMTVEELQRLDPAMVQLGIHGYQHENFRGMGYKEIRGVLLNSVKAFEESRLPYHRVFAYPFGALPSDTEDFKKVKQEMVLQGFQAAFRIGNKVSRVPAPDLFEIKRIDITGNDTIEKLAIKIKKGKLKPF